ncbi:MAG: acylphosphatase [Caldiserica bacterium]|nr:acylphosphatase [Caldisericota bacterium]
MGEKVRAHVFVSGVVQGVLFRYYTQKMAYKLGVKGWVRNTRDGRVEMVLEGEEEKVNKLIEWAHEGPPYASVAKVEVDWEDYLGEFDSFSIVY